MITIINILLIIILLPIALFSILLTIGLISFMVETVKKAIEEVGGSRDGRKKETTDQETKNSP